MRRFLAAMTIGAALTGAAWAAQVPPAQPTQPAQQPGPQAAPQQAPYTQGKVVRVDPNKNAVVVRIGEGQTARELEYKIVTGTKMWGADKQPLTDVARFQALKEGTPVWYRLGSGADVQTITEMRLHDPGAGQLGGKQ